MFEIFGVPWLILFPLVGLVLRSFISVASGLRLSLWMWILIIAWIDHIVVSNITRSRITSISWPTHLNLNNLNSNLYYMVVFVQNIILQWQQNSGMGFVHLFMLSLIRNSWSSFASITYENSQRLKRRAICSIWPLILYHNGGQAYMSKIEHWKHYISFIINYTYLLLV